MYVHSKKTKLELSLSRARAHAHKTIYYGRGLDYLVLHLPVLDYSSISGKGTPTQRFIYVCGRSNQ